MHKKNGQKINKSDKQRTLVTETLPYETPLTFSNDGFYKICKNSAKLTGIEKFIYERLVQGVGRGNSFHTIPYKYFIRKTQIEFRQLALLHPISQFEMHDFYAKYEKLICHFCSQSPFTIRAPSNVASTFYVKNSWENINKYKKEGVTEIESDQRTRHSSSYFSYRGHDRLYKFFNSDDFMELEKEFQVMQSLDVSKCFDSIYTHSIAWATKEKHYVKSKISIKSTFGGAFDSLMQHANHNETNGILIGPEISRIFAEIIFQDIDVKAQQRLLECELKQGLHYELRRYVDDVFIFARNAETANRVYRLYSEQLALYNLRTNSSKSLLLARPFLTAKSKVIREINDKVNEFVDKFLKKQEENSVLIPSKIHRKDRLARSFIDSIKGICLENQVTYDAVSSYLISAFFERTKRLINVEQSDVDDNGPENYRDSIQVLLELLYFFYSVSSSVSASYKLCASIILLCRFSEKHLGPFEHTIKQRVFELSLDLLSGDRIKSAADVRNFLFLEVLNVVLSICDLGDDYLLPESTVLELIADEPGYFQLTACLYYIKERSSFVNARKEIIKRIDGKLRSLTNVFLDTEQACMLVDMLVCPFVEKSKRMKWLKRFYKVYGVATPSEAEMEVFLKNDERRHWFTNWHEVDLLNALERKELRQVY